MLTSSSHPADSKDMTRPGEISRDCHETRPFLAASLRCGAMGAGHELECICKRSKAV